MTVPQFKCHHFWVAATNFCDIWPLVNEGRVTALWCWNGHWAMWLSKPSILLPAMAISRCPVNRADTAQFPATLSQPSTCSISGGSLICLVSNFPMNSSKLLPAFPWSCWGFFLLHHLLPRCPPKQLMEGPHMGECWSILLYKVLWCWSNPLFQNIFQDGGQRLQWDQVLRVLETGLGFAAGFPGILAPV